MYTLVAAVWIPWPWLSKQFQDLWSHLKLLRAISVPGFHTNTFHLREKEPFDLISSYCDWIMLDYWRGHYFHQKSQKIVVVVDHIAVWHWLGLRPGSAGCLYGTRWTKQPSSCNGNKDGYPVQLPVLSRVRFPVSDSVIRTEAHRRLSSSAKDHPALWEPQKQWGPDTKSAGVRPRVAACQRWEPFVGCSCTPNRTMLGSVPEWGKAWSQFLSTLFMRIPSGKLT